MAFVHIWPSFPLVFSSLFHVQGLAIICPSVRVGWLVAIASSLFFLPFSTKQLWQQVNNTKSSQQGYPLYALPLHLPAIADDHLGRIDLIPFQLFHLATIPLQTLDLNDLLSILFFIKMKIFDCCVFYSPFFSLS